MHRAVLRRRLREEERLLAAEIRRIHSEIGRSTRGEQVRPRTLAVLRAESEEVDRLAGAVAHAAATIREQLASIVLDQAYHNQEMVELDQSLDAMLPNAQSAQRVFALPSPTFSPPGIPGRRVDNAHDPMPPPLGALEAIRASLDELRPVILVESLPDDCAICIDSMLCGQSVVTLPCAHVYHGSCILRWLSRGSASCPLCKKPVQLGTSHTIRAASMEEHTFAAATGRRRRARHAQPAHLVSELSRRATHVSDSTPSVHHSATAELDLWMGDFGGGRRLTESVERLLRTGSAAVVAARYRGHLS